jgi:IS5 family transposase
VNSEQPSFADVEYGSRRRVSGRERFLEAMNAAIPWAGWVALIKPFYFQGRAGEEGPQGQAGGDDAADVSVAGVVFTV